MATSLPYPIHSMAVAVAQIDQGEDPWFAIGCFLHDWWCYAKNYRQELISEPPLPTSTRDGKRWAAFCAAAFEELCIRTPFPSLVLSGFMSQSMFSKILGSFPPKYRSVTGCFRRHPNFFDEGISSLVEAYSTISTNCNTPLIRNPGGLSGQTRIFRIWQYQMRFKGQRP